MKTLTLFLVLLVFVIEGVSQLTLERIFDKKEFEVSGIGTVKWLDGGDLFYIQENRAGEAAGIIRLYDTATGEPIFTVPAEKLIPEGKEKPLEIYRYTWSKDRRYVLIFSNTKKVWRLHTRGDYWIYDTMTEDLWQLGQGFASASLMFATFSPDNQRVAYVYHNNLYVEDLTSKAISQLTYDGSDVIINGTFDWVYEEEFRLRKGYRWRSDGKALAFWQLDATGVGIFHMINNTDSIYPKLIPIQYPKAGTVNSACRIGVIDTNGGQIEWLNLAGNISEYYIAWMEWIPRENVIVLQRLNRQQNTNWLLQWQPATGDIDTLLTDHDDAWLDVVKKIHWNKTNDYFTWISERDGWKHLYLVNRADRKQICATPGEYDVIELKNVNFEQEEFYFIASPDDASQRYLYRGDLNGNTSVERLTPQDKPGTNSYNIASSGKIAIHSYSHFDTPGYAALVSLPEHKTISVLKSHREIGQKLSELNFGPSEFFSVIIQDSVRIDGLIILPPDLEPNRKYPLLVHVYGEPAGQRVLDRWGGNRYMWHRMLSQQGYVVCSFDNRGTPAPRGREWRKCIYGQVGILATHDQAAAVRELIRTRSYIDSQRVGIWGWSGGGSMSLNAIFRYPELYRTAMSVAPVSNQRFYDTIYQERYMGLPQDNPDGYRAGSPITHAQNLRGNLLLVHGTGDDNVHYQSTEALVNKLIELNKKFTMMVYPNRSHSINEGNNTTLHLYSLLTDYLYVNLPPGVR